MSGLFTRRLVRELRATLVLAFPLMLGQLSSFGMNVIDVLLAGHHGAQTLAAVGIGSQLWSVVILVLIGVLMAVPPTVSQLAGAERRGEIGAVFRQALWLALAMGVLLLLFVRYCGAVLPRLGVDPEILPGVVAFLRGIGWGAPALALYFCCRNLSEGVGLTRPTLVLGIGGLIVLAPLGYLLMYGGAGLAAGGAGGLGAATTIVLWLQVASFALWLALSPRYADLRLFERFDPPRPALLADLLRIGLPMGVSVFMEGSLFIATGLIIASIGTVAVAAHTIALNVSAACYMIPLGVAMATTVRVGYAAGAGDPVRVRWAAGTGCGFALATQCGSALLLACGASTIAAGYTHDPAVAMLAIDLIGFAAVFQLSDGLQSVSAGALRGLKDTRVPMFITMIAYWGIGMPLGWWLGIDRAGGAPGMWVGLILGLSAAALLLTWRFWILAYRPLPPLPKATVTVHP